MNTLVRPASARRPRVSLWFLRLVATAHLVLVLAQPVLAGLFLTGDVDAVSVHSAIGTALGAVSMVLIATTLLYVVRRGSLWVLLAAVVLFFAVGLQIGMGYSRVLQIHVPLGVAIAVAAIAFTVWVWTPAATRTRGGAR